MMFTLISPFSILQDKGTRLEKNGKYQEAANVFLELGESIAHEPYGELESQKAMLQCAINLQRVGGDQMATALEIFDNLLKQPRGELTGQILREKAILLIKFDEAKLAIKLLDEAFTFFDDSDNKEVGAVISSVARANVKLGQKQEALSNFEKADSLLYDCNNIHELNNIIWWMDLLQYKESFSLKYRAIKLCIRTGYSIRVPLA